MIEPQYVQTDHEREELSEEDLEYLSENRVRPENFTKTNWKTAEARDKWDLREMSRAMSEAEWRSVFSGQTERKAAIIHVSHANRDKWLKRVGEYDLHYRDIRYTAPYDGYAHEHKDVDSNDPERRTYAVISQSKDIADKMEEAELELSGYSKHNHVGRLLGFPKCCRDWFWENWGLEENKNVDPLYEVACNTDSAVAIDGDNQNVRLEDPEPLNNILYRYWGPTFLTHIPCSFDCEGSADIAMSRGEIMADNGYRETANSMHEWLSMPMVWECRLGIAHVRNKDFIGSANSAGYWSMKRIVWGEEHSSRGVVEG